MDAEQITEQEGTDVQQKDSGTHIDESVATDQVSQQNPQGQPDLDWRSLYAQSVRERQMREAELETLRQQAMARPQEDLSVTDADIEKLGTVETIGRIVRKQLQETLGDVGEISRDFKKQKQLESAEVQFFQQFPHLAQYRDVLSGTIRGQLQASPSVDASTYATQAFATIGYYTAMNAATPPQQQTNTVPPRQATPTSRINGAPSPVRSAPKLSELERTAMRRAGYDPNKATDVDAFFTIVNNDEGISV
jgi:hypothetical protein